MASQIYLCTRCQNKIANYTNMKVFDNRHKDIQAKIAKGNIIDGIIARD